MAMRKERYLRTSLYSDGTRRLLGADAEEHGGDVVGTAGDVGDLDQLDGGLVERRGAAQHLVDHLVVDEPAEAVRAEQVDVAGADLELVGVDLDLVADPERAQDHRA